MHRQKISDPSESIHEVLSQVIGVYSTHPSGPLSLFARIKEMKREDLFEFEAQRKSIRIPCMRTSVHLVLNADSSNIFTATLPDPTTGYWVKQYEVKGKNLMDRDYQRWYPFIKKYAKTPVSLQELKENLDIPEDMMKFVVNRMAFEGKLVRVGSGSVTSNIISYIDSANWSGNDLYNNKRQNSLQWLAYKYFKGYGPARIRDFQWWTGCKVEEARIASSSIPLIDIGDDLMLLEDDMEEWTQYLPEKNSKQTIHILPQWDSYTMGYAPDGRQRFVENDFLKTVYGSIGATGGNAFGVILLNGKVSGIWKHKISRKAFKVNITPFGDDLISNETIDRKFYEVGEFLNSGEVNIEFTT